VPEIVYQASDDQIALAICFGAVVVSGVIMHFSLHLGRLSGRIWLHQAPEQKKLLIHEARPGHSTPSPETPARERAA
jgi:hypothetical protein